MRLKAMGQPRYRNGFEITLQRDLLSLPLKWSQPKMIFVNSMSDLFHDSVPEEVYSGSIRYNEGCTLAYISGAYETIGALGGRWWQVAMV